jgi:hypothetical protein
MEGSMNDTTNTNTSDLYAVTFAGLVVMVCSTKDEATAYAKDLRRAHSTVSIAVEVLG